MEKHKTLNRVITLLVAMMISICLSTAAMAAPAFTDISGHWAAAAINAGVAKGFINGYTDNTFKPNNPVTRAEFSKMINVAVGISNIQSASFTDVRSSDWFYPEIRKALAAGYISGYLDNSFKPNGSVTRQEAAVMIASIIPTAGTAPSLGGLTDNGSIAVWARAGVSKVFAKGYMTGDNQNRYQPLKSLTRAEAATILSNIIAKENIVSANTAISAAGTVAGSTIYANDLTISASLGSGTAELRGSMVLGTLNVLGGGLNSIGLFDTGVHNMTVAKSSGDVRVFLSGDSSVKDALVSSGGILEHRALSGAGFITVNLTGSALASQPVSLIGDFDQLYVNSPATVNSSAGTINNVYLTRNTSGGNIKMSGSFNNVTLEGRTLFELLSGQINLFTINAAAANSSVKLNSSGSINTAVVDGAAAAFTGLGTINRLEANANDISYETTPNRVVTAANVIRPPVVSADITPPAPDFLPVTAAVNVPANTRVTIAFNEPIFLASGNPVTAAGIAGLIELREGSTTGAKRTYTATISADKRKIVLTPDALLNTNTIYQIIVLNNAVADISGNLTPRTVSAFRTGLQDFIVPFPTFTPQNGALNVALNAPIAISFSEPVFHTSGAVLTTANFNLTAPKNIILLRQNAFFGSDVPYTAVVSSDKRTITITPASGLTVGATYYLVVNADMLQDAAGNVVPLTYVSFSTAALVVPVASLSLDQAAVNNLQVGPAASPVLGMVQLNPIFTPANASNQNIVWQSSNISAATVNSSGLVTAVGAGTAAITAISQADSTKSAVCFVTVTFMPVVPVSGVTLDLAAVPDLQLGAGAVKTAVQLTATIAPANASNKNAVWQSSNPAVASVNASTGYVTAVGAGTATITVTTADGGLTAGCDVTVTLVP